MTVARAGLAAVAGALIALLVREGLADRPGLARPPAAAAVERTVIHHGDAAVDVGALRDEVRRAIRDELAAAPVAAAEPAPAEAPVVAGPEGDAAAALVATAIGRGRWTSDDQRQLHGLLAAVDEPTGREVLLALTVAINEQRLVPEAPL